MIWDMIAFQLGYVTLAEFWEVYNVGRLRCQFRPRTKWIIRLQELP